MNSSMQNVLRIPLTIGVLINSNIDLNIKRPTRCSEPINDLNKLMTIFPLSDDR